MKTQWNMQEPELALKAMKLQDELDSLREEAYRRFEIYCWVRPVDAQVQSCRTFRVKSGKDGVATHFEMGHFNYPVEIPFGILYMSKPEIEALAKADNAKKEAEEKALEAWHTMRGEAEHEDYERNQLATLEAKYRAQPESPSVPTPEEDASDDGEGHDPSDDDTQFT